MATRIGVDVGGTFTDLIFLDDGTGEILVGKRPTSPATPEVGVLDVLERSLSGPQFASAAYFLHGTTVGLNALIERRGAVVGLLATDGFRDVLELRRGDRDDPYDLFWKPPAPLVPRDLRIPVRERIRADGVVHRELVAADVSAAVELFRSRGVDAVAVTFMNAYANPRHELEAERLLRAAGFDGDVSLSHRVSGEYREYERSCTTVIDAFVRRRMGPYLTRLDSQLGGRGFAGEAMIMRSGGGAMTFAEAASRPFETILSGPVAGADAVAQLARELELPHVIGADVGGTSFDTCLIDDGRPPVLYEGEVIGLPIQTPWVDVRSIGAGGGSIARADAGGLMRVGPESAGADPGPAAYGRGGEEATVTDAALVLGMLPAGDIAGGVRLSRELAGRALTRLAGRLGFATAEQAARGVIEITSAQMADAIRSITVERGRDPREAAVVAFGGAGPLFGTLLADELNARLLVVPPHAGNFSAWGLLGADLSRTASRTRVLRVSPDGLDAAAAVARELFDELDRRVANVGDRADRQVHLDIRFVGQEHTLTVIAPSHEGGLALDCDELERVFRREYERTFGSLLDESIEIVCVRAIVTTPLRRHAPLRLHAGTPAPAAGASLDAWSFTAGRELPFAVHDRGELAAGARLAGPAIIREPTATTYLDAGHVARVHPTGALIVTGERAA